MFVSPYQTQLTRELREGKRGASVNMHNRKPYRSAALKAKARKEASREPDGAYRSIVPVLFHPAPRKGGR